MTPRLDIRGVSKAYPGVRALDRVSLAVEPGRVHALLGENGAGKSTLGRILAGVTRADAGEILLDGAPLAPDDERDAALRGIGIVHQEGSLVPQLSIAENVFAGHLPAGFLGRLDRRAMVAGARALLDRLGLPLDPALPVAALSSAQAQVVEIAKALSRDLRVLILDEPTAALTLTETDRLFAVIRQLAAAGVSVIYISHRLAEIFEISQRVTVLKDGRLSGTVDTARSSENELIGLMVGRDIQIGRQPPARPPGEMVLQVDGIAAAGVASASLGVRRGEIVCLAGLIGSGRSETCEAIFGARRLTAGSMRLRGARYAPRGPWEAMASGIGMVPEDRKTSGLFLSLDIGANISASVLDRVSARGLMRPERVEALAQRYIRDLRVATPSARQSVGHLSGGNQQKVLLAKWLARSPDLLIVDEPTRGVDVGARSDIYRILRGLAADGMALLLVSSDLPEVLALADRILVMADGRTVGELPGETADEESVLRLATRHTRLDVTRQAA